MDKTEYLDALKRNDRPGAGSASQDARLLRTALRRRRGHAYCSEADIAAEQDDPRKIAMTLRANSHMAAFEQKRNPANFVRMAFAAVGLAIFNLFMVVPAAVYAAVVTTMYICGLTFYLADKRGDHGGRPVGLRRNPDRRPAAPHPVRSDHARQRRRHAVPGHHRRRRHPHHYRARRDRQAARSGIRRSIRSGNRSGLRRGKRRQRSGRRGQCGRARLGLGRSRSDRRPGPQSGPPRRDRRQRQDRVRQRDGR
ncbi:DUF1700 domain-containing protein [Massilia sp. B-10]|nr:DUF1700 domain-containing protein [Massilia sp. B-10]